MAALETFPLLTHILIPLDGSPLAEAILAPALEIGRLTPTLVTLLQVIEPDMLVDALVRQSRPHDLHAESRQRHDQAQAYLDRIARQLQHHGLQATALVVVADHPAEGILRVARQQAVELIAMATHGRGGLSDLIIGSVADKVLRTANCPMLVYRPAQEPAETQHGRE
jgi:nucleotide-binding universal stress UspA family protein